MLSSSCLARLFSSLSAGCTKVLSILLHVFSFFTLAVLLIGFSRFSRCCSLLRGVGWLVLLSGLCAPSFAQTVTPTPPSLATIVFSTGVPSPAYTQPPQPTGLWWTRTPSANATIIPIPAGCPGVFDAYEVSASYASQCVRCMRSTYLAAPPPSGGLVGFALPTVVLPTVVLPTPVGTVSPAVNPNVTVVGAYTPAPTLTPVPTDLGGTPAPTLTPQLVTRLGIIRLDYSSGLNGSYGGSALPGYSYVPDDYYELWFDGIAISSAGGLPAPAAGTTSSFSNLGWGSGWYNGAYSGITLKRPMRVLSISADTYLQSVRPYGDFGGGYSRVVVINAVPGVWVSAGYNQFEPSGYKRLSSDVPLQFQYGGVGDVYYAGSEGAAYGPDELSWVDNVEFVVEWQEPLFAATSTPAPTATTFVPAATVTPFGYVDCMNFATNDHGTPVIGIENLDFPVIWETCYRVVPAVDTLNITIGGVDLCIRFVRMPSISILGLRIDLLEWLALGLIGFMIRAIFKG